MDRNELESQVLWTGGGYGFGIGDGILAWGMQEPCHGEPDWPSVVSVHGDKALYTDEELATIVAYARDKTAQYDKMFRVRMGANIVIIGKEVYDWVDPPRTRWLRKRLTWQSGPMHSDTLDEAIAYLYQMDNIPVSEPSS